MPEVPPIFRGGQAISPREVEAVLLAHPLVAEAAVVGIADRVFASIVAAAVRLTAPAPCPAAELTEFCLTRLAPYQIPVRWLFTSALPRTPSGTVHRDLVTAQLTVVSALDRSAWTAQSPAVPSSPPPGRGNPPGPAQPGRAVTDPRIPYQVRRSSALEDLDYL